MRRLKAKRAVLLSVCVIALGTLAGCIPGLPDNSTDTPSQAIDFVKAHRLAAALFEVSLTTTISDDQLTVSYQTGSNEVLVRSTTFAGDKSPSRYMFIKDHAARTQTIYLSGTNSDTLWQFDLDLAMVKESDLRCNVHRGFNNAALTVLDDVLPRLEVNYPTTVTGYSIGGAMAVLLAQYLNVNGYPVTEVITFGQPKVTDAAGAASFANLPLLRFVNHKDPIPHLPPDGPASASLVHFGPEVILYDGAEYAYMNEANINYASSTTGDISWILFKSDFSEHGTLYVDRLAAKADHATQIPYRWE